MINENIIERFTIWASSHPDRLESGLKALCYIDSLKIAGLEMEEKAALVDLCNILGDC